jgi:hypothetical protein
MPWLNAVVVDVTLETLVNPGLVCVQFVMSRVALQVFQLSVIDGAVK